MSTTTGLIAAWEYLARNTHHRDWTPDEQKARMTDAYDLLKEFSDDLILIGAQRIALMASDNGGKCWFPLPAEWRKACLEWARLGFSGAVKETDVLAMMREPTGNGCQAARQLIGVELHPEGE